LPPVEVILTVVAVIPPVLPDWPRALTQSPTAREEAAVDCVSDNVVEVPIVIFSFCVFGALVFLAPFLGCAKPLSRVPSTETEVPLTAVTSPLAIVTFAPANDPRPFEPLPLDPLGGPLPPPGNPAAPLGGPLVPEGLPPSDPVPLAPPRPVAHFPVDEGWLIVIERAVTVVLDFLAGVPVTVRQSPTATADSVSVTLSEKVVDEVHSTVVWPELVLCTSMVVPEIDATLPLATPPDPGDEAAPASLDSPTMTVPRRTAMMAPPHLRAALASREPFIKMVVSFRTAFTGSFARRVKE
jgi:hypothetical protein